MRQLCRIYLRQDGGISVVHPAWDDHVSGFGKTEHATEAEWYEWAVARNMPAGWVSKGDVDVATLPTREFRDCWRWDYEKQQCYVDPVLEATEQWKRIRAERDKRLMWSDVEYLQALDVEPLKVAEWKAYRQALRNLPQVQTNPKNIIWPAVPI